MHLTQRVERFRTAVLDFAGDTHIGTGVRGRGIPRFANAHPDVELVATHATPRVQQMIRRAEAARDEGRI